MGRQTQSLGEEHLPLLLRQDAAGAARRRQYMVVGPEEEQHLHLVPVIPVQLLEGHLVHGRRDGAHAVLAHHQLPQSQKLLTAHRSVSEDFHKLIHHLTHQLPELGILVGELEPSLTQQRLRPGGELSRHIQLLQKAVEGQYLPLGGLGGAQGLTEPGEGQAYPLPDGVDLLQTLSLLLRELLTVAVRVGGPRGIPQPHGPVDLPLEHIVLKEVALPVTESRQPRLEAAEHVLVLKAPGHRLQRSSHQCHQRLLQKVTAPAEVHRHLVAAEDVLHRRLVVLEVAHRHADIPVAKPLLRRQTADLRRGILHLAVEGGGLVEAQSLPPAAAGPPPPKVYRSMCPKAVVTGGASRRTSSTAAPHSPAMRTSLSKARLPVRKISRWLSASPRSVTVRRWTLGSIRAMACSSCAVKWEKPSMYTSLPVR